jgi:uncharacterized protein
MEYFYKLYSGLARQVVLEKRGYTLESLKNFRRNFIKNTSPDEAQRLGQELHDLISSKTYIKNENTTIPRALIFDGANLEVRNEKGSTGIIVCAQNNLYDTFSLYVMAGADINARNNFQSTACMWAARKGHEEILFDLILLDADINRQCSDGENALHSAARHNQLVCVKLLIEAGAILNIININGQDALGIANVEGHSKIAKMLSEAADINLNNKTPDSICSLDIVKHELQLAKVKLKKLSSM